MFYFFLLGIDINLFIYLYCKKYYIISLYVRKEATLILLNDDVRNDEFNILKWSKKVT